MKKILVIVLCFIICFSLCACSSVESELQNGIWCIESVVFGSVAKEEFEFDEDGEFIMMFYCDNKFINMELGTYEIKNSEIVLTYESGSEITIDYTYNAGKLTLKKGSGTMYNRKAKV